MDFVTGGTGIVGRELLYQLLSRGREVKALRRPKSDIEGTESQIISRGASIQKLTFNPEAIATFTSYVATQNNFENATSISFLHSP